MKKIIAVIKEIEERKTNFVPRVAMYSQIAERLPRVDIRSLLAEACIAKKLCWGYNPWGIVWFATQLSEEDIDTIKESSWTIEQNVY